MMLTRRLLAGDAPTYVNGQLIAEETVLHHVSEKNEISLQIQEWSIGIENLRSIILSNLLAG